MLKQTMAEYTSIYDRYNISLTTDQPHVDDCMNAIQSQMDSTIAQNLPSYFDFDLTPFIGTLDIPSQIRIKDRIIFNFRTLGIGCFIMFSGTVNVPNVTSTNSVSYAINFNSQYISTSLVLRIRWFVRNDTEFGKSYV